MKSLASLIAAAISGIEWANESYYSAIFFFFVAFSLTEIPSKIEDAVDTTKGRIRNGFNFGSEKFGRTFSFVLFGIFCLCFYLLFEGFDRVFGMEDALKSLGEFGALILLLATYWIAVGLTVLVLFLVGLFQPILKRSEQEDG